MHLDVFFANRFGRIAELSREYTNNHALIKRFFEEVVDENANKLVLAVSTYINNEWFALCCKLYTHVGELIIFPLMDLFGIDRHTRHKGDDSQCDWFGVKGLFSNEITRYHHEAKDSLHRGDHRRGQE